MNPAFPLTQLFVTALTLWIVGLGASMLIQCHKGYLKATKTIFLSPFKALWKSHSTAIMAIILGILIGIWLMLTYAN